MMVEMIDDKKLKKYRNKVIERLNHTDILVSSIIAKSYFSKPGVPINFVSNVLYQPPLSFSSRVNMLKGILKDIKQPNSKLIKKLIEMSNIRNIFAHCELIIKIKGQIEYYFNPKDYLKPINFENVYKKFNELDKEINPILISMYEKLEGEKLKRIKVKRGLVK